MPNNKVIQMPRRDDFNFDDYRRGDDDDGRPHEDDDSDRPRRRRRFRSDEDDYDDDYDYGRRRYQEEHRGTMILIFGILGLVVCGLFAPIAWIMGSADLAKMRSGTMDNLGYGSTQAGYVLGIIGTVFIVLGLLFFCVFFGMMGAAGKL